MTCENVAVETPARAATSRMVDMMTETNYIPAQIFVAAGLVILNALTHLRLSVNVSYRVRVFSGWYGYET
jgi:hypothetical protein